MQGGKGGWEFCLEESWPFNACVMLHIRFSNHQLIKISMIYRYIKPEVNKINTIMAAAINEACIRWLHENCYLVKVIFLVLAMSFFCCWVEFSRPPSTGFRPNGMFGGRGREVHTWWWEGGNKQDESKMENTGGTIQEDNSPRHCFVLRDSIPMTFFT